MRSRYSIREAQTISNIIDILEWLDERISALESPLQQKKQTLGVLKDILTEQLQTLEEDTVEDETEEVIEKLR